MSTVLRVEDVSKCYRLGRLDRRELWREWRAKWLGDSQEDEQTFWSLRHVTLDVRQGEVVGLLGGNGAGKSTLLKIISHITTPTSGRIRLLGRVASLLEVGPGFHPELTGRDNIFINGAILGMTHREVSRKLEEIVAFSGIETFIDTPVKRYSVGMRVRLAFAIAAHLEPEILLVDEVLAVGDAVFQQKCLGKIDEVTRTGRTVLFVSHNAAAIESLCTRGVVLEKGRVVFDGSQTGAVEYYAASRVAHGSDLRQRLNRTGTGEIRAVAIEIRNDRGQVIPVARAGEAVEIALRFERHPGSDYPRVSVQIHVTTHLGAPVFMQANWLGDTLFGTLPESGEFLCRIPRLPLPAGHFRIGYSLRPDSRTSEVLDQIDSALDLHVEPGGFFGSSRLPSLQTGVALVDADWKLRTLSELPEPVPAS